MPVRKIGKSATHLTGKIALPGHDRLVSFEGAVERDFFMLTSFENAGALIEEQPVTIPYTDHDGVCRRYTPDALVHYADGRIVLYEIKTAKELRSKRRELQPKFDAANHFAQENGWKFKIVRDTEIRTQRLSNIRFLWRLVEETPTPHHAARIFIALKKFSPVSVDALTSLLDLPENEKLLALRTIWVLLAQRRVQADLDAPLTNETLVTSCEAPFR